MANVVGGRGGEVMAWVLGWGDRDELRRWGQMKGKNKKTNAKNLYRKYAHGHTFTRGSGGAMYGCGGGVQTGNNGGDG